MEVVGYLIALLAGILLGLIGGGGSIIIVPLLIYVFRVEPLMATVYSLFIVGTTSLFGVLPKYKMGLVDLKAALIFGIPSTIAVFITRRYIIPAIPATIANINGVEITKQSMLLLVFGLLMILASLSMILEKNKKEAVITNNQQYNFFMIIFEGSLEGFITGLVGAGGGFLIIAILVLFSRLPMKRAIGTSLLIIAAKSLIGFSSDVMHYTINWKLLTSITILAISGIFIGNKLSYRISGESLKKGFGWFVLTMGLYIITREFFLKLN
jgi:uncharacterized protein